MLKILIFYFVMVPSSVFVVEFWNYLQWMHVVSTCVSEHTHKFILRLLLLLISEVITGKIMLMITAEIDN